MHHGRSNEDGRINPNRENQRKKPHPRENEGMPGQIGQGFKVKARLLLHLQRDGLDSGSDAAEDAELIRNRVWTYGKTPFQ